MNKITMYILTHKKFDYEDIGEKTIYKPLLCGSASLNEDFGYIRDDTGDNISDFNKYYAELTGEYWVWKNDNSDIVGFCHYRRYFTKNIFLNKLTSYDIQKSLDDYDIILPQKICLGTDVLEDANLSIDIQREEDYVLLRKILAKESPEYLDSYDEFLNEKEIYNYNMFICRKEIADDYFKWLFNILEIFKDQTDFSQYEKGNARILGYLSERLLNVYVKKHKLKVNEKYVLHSEARLPIHIIIENKFPFIKNSIKYLLKVLGISIR